MCFQKVFTIPCGMEGKVEEKESAVGVLTAAYLTIQIGSPQFSSCRVTLL